jgi:hypothetical protein
MGRWLLAKRQQPIDQHGLTRAFNQFRIARAQKNRKQNACGSDPMLRSVQIIGPCAFGATSRALKQINLLLAPARTFRGTNNIAQKVYFNSYQRKSSKYTVKFPGTVLK